LLATATILLVVTSYYFHWRKVANVPSIVVLPFLNLSGNSESEYLSEGVTEELTTELAEVRGLRVVARTSAFQFRGKGEDVRRIGNR
jgi:TolB-like protein